MSTATIHPAAPHHLPLFITAPGETDSFLVGAAMFLVVMIIAAGSLYFRLHALPEHLAHRTGSKLQFEVVAVLSLIALFTHNTSFWIAALMLALIPIPNLHGPLAAMAESLATMAGWRRSGLAVETAPIAETAPQSGGGEPAAVHSLPDDPPQGAEVPPPVGDAGHAGGSLATDQDARRGRPVPTA